MAEKYYIANGNKVIGRKNVVDSIDSSLDRATRFKYTEALDYLKKFNGDTTWGFQRMYSSKSRKNYIITNATNFVGNGREITTLFSKAKSFKSVADAEAYIKNHRELVKSFGDVFIMNENMETFERSDHKMFTADQLKTIGVNKKPTKRVMLSWQDRVSVYEKSNRVCCICGKPLDYGEMTVDHIMPISRGGKNNKDNLRCTCEECNSIKGSNTDQEMYSKLSNICAIEAFRNPEDEAWNMLIRGKVRGTIRKYLGGIGNDNTGSLS